MGRFRRIFNPTKEEQIYDLEMLLRLHEEQIGHCCTCLNHILSDATGFVTDFGECKANSQIFAIKACGLIDDPCPLYEENAEEVIGIKQNIQQLRQPAEEQ